MYSLKINIIGCDEQILQPAAPDIEDLISQIAPPESADGAGVKQDGFQDQLARAFSLS